MTSRPLKTARTISSCSASRNPSKPKTRRRKSKIAGHQLLVLGVGHGQGEVPTLDLAGDLGEEFGGECRQ